MGSRFGSIFAVVAAMILACAGVVVAQPTESEQTTGEELIEPASSLDAGDVIPDRYIVVLDENRVSDAAAVASELAQPLGLEVTHTYENALKGFAVRVPSGLDLASALNADGRVDFVAEDRVVEATAQVRPTGINRVEADLSRTQAGSGSGAVDSDIAILDTGIYNHPDLHRVGGYNCTSNNTAAYGDGNGHGTHVAGSAAARDNSGGVVGVAPGARLQAVKVLGDDGSGSFASIICGVDWVTGENTDSVTSNDIEVANMSLGGTGTDDGNCGNTDQDALHRAICGSVAAGITYTVAAGNDNIDFATTIPATYDEVLTVTAIADFNGQPGGGAAPTCRTDVDDTAANFSNYTSTSVSSDQNHTIAAPGVCIRSTWKGIRKKVRGRFRVVPGYQTISGTSMASPHVAGTAALCIASKQCAPNNPPATMTKLRSDAAAQPSSYGFAGDPNRPSGTRYYGYLEYAGGY